MEIIFYYNKSETYVINKDIVEKFRVNGTLREECSLIRPVVNIQRSSLSDVNYVHIPEFNRYYFIVNVTSVRNNLWRVELLEDYLESFKTDVLNLSCIVDKNSYQSNFYIDDGSYVDTVKTKTETIMFQRGLEEQGEYILITAGGTQS